MFFTINQYAKVSINCNCGDDTRESFLLNIADPPLVDLLLARAHLHVLLSLSIYIYVYLYIYICVYIYIYIYDT